MKFPLLSLPFFALAAAGCAVDTPQDDFDDVYFVVSAEPEDFPDGFMSDALSLRVRGRGHDADEYRAEDKALQDAKGRLLSWISTEISRDEGRDGEIGTMRVRKSSGRVNNVFPVAKRVAFNPHKKNFRVEVGIEFSRKNLSDDKTEVLIERPVLIGEREDRNSGAFPAKIVGGKTEYLDGESEKGFVVVPERDAYFMLFWIGKDGRADVTFPRGGGNAEFLRGGAPFRLPPITFRVDNPNAGTEACRLVFVLTEARHAFRRPSGKGFYETLDADEIRKWILSLPEDGRFERFLDVTIRR